MMPIRYARGVTTRRLALGLVLAPILVQACGDDEGDAAATTGGGAATTTSSTSSASGGNGGGGAGGGPFCGDANVDPGESCDDGNDVQGDGCNDDCVESATELWTTTYGGPDALGDLGYGVVTDARGNIFVAGAQGTATQGTDLLVQKHGPDGSVIWSKTANGLGNADDRGLAIAVDGAGYVVVAGVAQPMNGTNSFVRKYDTDGNIAWTKIGTAEVAYGVAIDAAGDVVMVGEEAGATLGSDVVVAKLAAADGSEIWKRTYDGDAQNSDHAFGVALDSTGSAVVIGEEYTISNGGDYDVLVLKYDAGGTFQWKNTYDGPLHDDDGGQAVAIAANDDIVVAGELAVSGQSSNVWISKLTPGGATVWTVGYDTDGDFDAAYGVHVDSTGDVVACGSERVAGDDNVWVRKLDGAGELKWARSYDGAQGTDRGYGIATDATDEVIVVGRVATGPSPNDVDLWLRKYAP
jgi:cysteine-rich repeat protein